MALTLFFILYCLEAGLFFLVVPWTKFWTANPLLHATPAVAVVAGNAFFRGFVSGFGLIHLIVGTREALGLFRRDEPRDRRHRRGERDGR